MKKKSNNYYIYIFYIFFFICIFINLSLIYLYYSNISKNNLTENFEFDPNVELNRCKNDKINLKEKYNKIKQENDNYKIKLIKVNSENNISDYNKSKDELNQQQNFCSNQVNALNTKVDNTVKEAKKIQQQNIEEKKQMQQTIINNNKENDIKILKIKTEYDEKIAVCNNELSQAKTNNILCQNKIDFNNTVPDEKSILYNSCLQKQKDNLNEINSLKSKIKDLENKLEYNKYTNTLQTKYIEPSDAGDLYKKYDNNISFTYIPNISDNTNIPNIHEIKSYISKLQNTISEISPNIPSGNFEYIF